MDPWGLSATDAIHQMRSGELTAATWVDSILARIDELNPQLNAFVSVDHTGARQQAAAADRERADGRKTPLLGVPVSIKANLDVAGQPNSAGVVAFADKIAPEDAPSVRNLRKAGAIIIGRTNTPEFGIRGTTFNPLFGRTHNPWHPDASPGGSSGGAGAAAAAGFGPMHQGSDIGGSLRFPAFGCGVATVKPSSNRVPAFNSSSSSERGLLSQIMSCQGMIAPTVGDVRLATEVMIGADPRDPNHQPLPWAGPKIDGPITVAISRDWGPAEPHPGIVTLLDRAADHLSDAGYDVVEATAPAIEDAFRMWLDAAGTEMAVGLRPAVERFGSESVQQLLAWTVEAGTVLDRDGYMMALGGRTKLTRAWSLFLEDHPLVLTPFMTHPMYDWDFDEHSFDAVNDVLERAMHAFGINFLGLPAGVIGMDLVEDRPAGVQIVGRRYREDLICDALEAIEHRNGVMSHRLWAGANAD